jgi:hypothetical protein
MVPNGGPISPPKSGSQIGVPNWGPKLGSQIRVPNRGPKSGSQIGVPSQGPEYWYPLRQRPTILCRKMFFPFRIVFKQSHYLHLAMQVKISRRFDNVTPCICPLLAIHSIVLQVFNLVGRNGHTMEIRNCPEPFDQLMRDCWQREPENRPCFVSICERLLPFADQVFRDQSFITSASGQNVIQHLEAPIGIPPQDEELPIEEAERAPLRANGNSNSNSNGNGNGDARMIDNGHIVGPAIDQAGTSRSNTEDPEMIPVTTTSTLAANKLLSSASSRQHNVWERFRTFWRPRHRSSQSSPSNNQQQPSVEA